LPRSRRLRSLPWTARESPSGEISYWSMPKMLMNPGWMRKGTIFIQHPYIHHADNKHNSSTGSRICSLNLWPICARIARGLSSCVAEDILLVPFMMATSYSATRYNNHSLPLATPTHMHTTRATTQHLFFRHSGDTPSEENKEGRKPHRISRVGAIQRDQLVPL